MKGKRGFLTTVLLAMALAFVVPSFITVPDVAAKAEAADVKINKKKSTLVKGQTVQLKISGTSKKVTWSSSKNSVAKVDAKGKVTAKKKGTATITAKVGKQKYTCKVTVVTPKISKTKATITVKNSLTLSISGTSAKVKWKSSNANVAKVSSKGKVTGKKAGTATITATVLGKQYKCKVTVTKGFNASSAKANLKTSTYRVDNGVIAVIKNNYTKDVRVDITCCFYDSSGKLIAKSTDFNNLLESGNTCAQFMYGPLDSNYNYINYSKYKVSYSASKPYATGCDVSKISCTSNRGNNNVMVTVKNKGNTNDSTIVSIVFYKNGKPIAYDYQYANVGKKGQTDYLQFNYPYDHSTYETIVPTSYKVYVNCSYKY